MNVWLIKNVTMTLSGILVIVNVSTKKAAKLTRKEECEEIIDSITQNKNNCIKGIGKNCKPFIALSILFVSVSIILTGIVVYFYVKSRHNDVLPH